MFSTLYFLSSPQPAPIAPASSFRITGVAFSIDATVTLDRLRIHAPAIQAPPPIYLDRELSYLGARQAEDR